MIGGVGLGPYDQLAPESVQHVEAQVPEFPITMLTVPAHWVLVMPCGCVDGVLAGSTRHATAEAAWATFTPSKRSRDSEARKGWLVRPGTQADAEWDAPCPHTKPKTKGQPA